MKERARENQKRSSKLDPVPLPVTNQELLGFAVEEQSACETCGWREGISALSEMCKKC